MQHGGSNVAAKSCKIYKYFRHTLETEILAYGFLGLLITNTMSESRN